jgi:hypothetical protein
MKISANVQGALFVLIFKTTLILSVFMSVMACQKLSCQAIQ